MLPNVSSPTIAAVPLLQSVSISRMQSFAICLISISNIECCCIDVCTTQIDDIGSTETTSKVCYLFIYWQSNDFYLFFRTTATKSNLSTCLRLSSSSLSVNEFNRFSLVHRRSTSNRSKRIGIIYDDGVANDRCRRYEHIGLTTCRQSSVSLRWWR